MKGTLEGILSCNYKKASAERKIESSKTKRKVGWPEIETPNQKNCYEFGAPTVNLPYNLFIFWLLTVLCSSYGERKVQGQAHRSPPLLHSWRAPYSLSLSLYPYIYLLLYVYIFIYASIVFILVDFVCAYTYFLFCINKRHSYYMDAWGYILLCAIKTRSREYYRRFAYWIELIVNNQWSFGLMTRGLKKNRGSFTRSWFEVEFRL